MIPSIGRICWVNMPVRSDQLCAAIVTYVHSESLVNLACFDRNGDIHPLMRMEFYHGDDGKVPVGRAGWMPYQVQAQAKAEAKPQVSVEEFEFMKGQIRALTSLLQQLQDSAQPKPQIIPQAATAAQTSVKSAAASPAKP